MRIHGRVRLAGSTALCAVVVSGCAFFGLAPDGGESNLMLHGNDPVAYFNAGRAAPGNPGIRAEHRGGSYRFASDENRRQFITSPDRYAPQFDGFSALSMANAVPASTDGGTFTIIDGRLYLFENPRERLYFEMDQERNLRRATQYWESEVRDATSFHMQALKRLVWRVPGYKSDADLADEYERRFGRKP